MNRSEIIIALETIRNSIIKEYEINKDTKLSNNYKHGIELCDNMIMRVKDTNVAFTSETLLGAFSRYAVDSLPWSGDIMKVYGEQSAIIKQKCNIK